MRFQRKSLQADLFNEVIKRIHDIQDQQKDYEKEGKILDWYVRLFDAFEYYAFFANHKDLSGEMATYYASSIREYYELAEKHEDVVKYLRNRPKGQLDELQQYYKTFVGKTPPF